MRNKVGLLIFYDKLPSKEAHIVFNTRNLTKSITKPYKTSSNIGASEDEESTAGFTKSCLLSSHGLKCNGGDTSSLKPNRFEHTLNLLPLTICTNHGTASFLPLDYVRKLPEYTRTTHNYPAFKVIHSFEDCILEFPQPPPIGSSEEPLFRHDYMNKCYQCFAKLPFRKTIYMYRDYLFCCPGCRLKASATHYWYKKAMRAVNEEGIGNGNSITTMERGTMFTIESSS